MKLKIIYMVFLAVLVFSVTGRSEITDTKDLVKSVRNAVVTIYTYDLSGKEHSIGSGFFISEQGYLVTNYHVVEKAASAKVKTSTGQLLSVDYIVAESKDYDLVKLKVNGFKPIKDDNGQNWLQMSDNVPEVGESILVIGSPIGLELTVSAGIISACRRSNGVPENFSINVPENGAGSVIPSNNPMLRVQQLKPITKNDHYIIQIDASISPGSSGGPVLTQDGKVIGIACSQMRVGQNLNFAIPAVEAINLVAFPEIKTLTEWCTGLKANPGDSNNEIMNREKMLGPDWVLTFNDQMKTRGIWDGKSVHDEKRLKNKWSAQIRNINSARRGIVYSPTVEYESGYYERNGHLYCENEYAYLVPVDDQKVSQIESIGDNGRVISVVDTSNFIVMLDSFDTPIMVTSRPSEDLLRGNSASTLLRAYSFSYNRNNGSMNTNYFLWTGTYKIIKDNRGLKVKYDLYVPSAQGISQYLITHTHPEPAQYEDYCWYIYCSGLESDLEAGMIEPDADCETCNGSGWIDCELCGGQGEISISGNTVVKSSGQGNEFIQSNSSYAVRRQVKKVKCLGECHGGKIACPNCVSVGRVVYKENYKQQYLDRFGK